MQIQFAGHADTNTPYCIIQLSISWGKAPENLLKLIDNKGIKHHPDYPLFKINDTPTAEMENFWEERKLKVSWRSS